MKSHKYLLALIIGLSGTAHAGTYRIGHGADCPLMNSRDVYNLINEVGIETGLNLKDNYEIAGELRCMRQPGDSRNVYSYTYRATIQKQIIDDGVKRWVPVAEQTSYGMTDGTSPWVAELKTTMRNLIRQFR
jgi:hypothetical protein